MATVLQLGLIRRIARPKLAKLRFELRDLRVAIVRHHVHPGFFALLRDGARIARGSDVGL